MLVERRILLIGFVMLRMDENADACDEMRFLSHFAGGRPLRGHGGFAAYAVPVAKLVMRPRKNRAAR